MDGNLAEQQSPFFPNPAGMAGKLKTERIAVIGLGYVGLPLAVALSRNYEDVTGFDINRTRVRELSEGLDRTNEVDRLSLLNCGLATSADSKDLCGTSLFVVAVPTPVDGAKRPDLGPLSAACRLIAPHLTKGSIVLFESTVFPGATEGLCASELERYSGYQQGVDFHVAYSPERINPGDHQHSLGAVKKIISANSDIVFDRIAAVYGTVVGAGIFRAASIKVAEAAKVFENTQRDVNIALMNEFALICDRLDIRTRDVIEATGTKWNALPFTPGLVGGHCIGVDPYYLASRAEEAGVFAEIILAARRRNDAMAMEVARRALRRVSEMNLRPKEARIGIFGVAFKENVPDIRNSRVADIVTELRDFGIEPLVNDPVVRDAGIAPDGIDLEGFDQIRDLDILILAVPHRAYLGGQGRFLAEFVRNGGMIMDVKSCLDQNTLRPDISYWSL